MKSIVSKPWGSYEVLEKGDTYTIKKLIVKPNGVLSLQSHEHRSEHWVVVDGEAEITLNDEIQIVKANNSVFIPIKTKHRISNKGQINLIIIEVWYGDSLDEEDIIRYEDIYNRK